MTEPPKAAAKITVPLIGEAVIALDNTAAQLGLSKTDTVNRALQAYAFLMTLQNTPPPLRISNFREELFPGFERM